MRRRLAAASALGVAVAGPGALAFLSVAQADTTTSSTSTTSTTAVAGSASAFAFLDKDPAELDTFLDTLDVTDGNWSDNLGEYLRGVPLPTTTSSTSTTAKPVTTTTAKPATTTTAGPQVFTGTNEYKYGTLTLKVTVQGGKVTAIQATGPTDPTTTAINNDAFPALQTKALAAQNATFATDGISGATYTVAAYKSALQVALTAAHLA